jgi:hypothetical protein
MFVFFFFFLWHVFIHDKDNPEEDTKVLLMEFPSVLEQHVILQP